MQPQCVPTSKNLTVSKNRRPLGFFCSHTDPSPLRDHAWQPERHFWKQGKGGERFFLFRPCAPFFFFLQVATSPPANVALANDAKNALEAAKEFLELFRLVELFKSNGGTRDELGEDDKWSVLFKRWSDREMTLVHFEETVRTDSEKMIEEHLKVMGYSTFSDFRQAVAEQDFARKFLDVQWNHVHSLLELHDVVVQGRCNAAESRCKQLECHVTVQHEDEMKKEVKHVQSMLSKLGFKVSCDGVFGDQTFRAVKLFQEKNQMPGTGIVDVNTRRELERMSNEEQGGKKKQGK